MSPRALRELACRLVIVTALVLASAAPAAAQQVPGAPSCNPPTISGTARDGEVLTANRGSCSGLSPSVSLQWFLCNAALERPCTARTGQVQNASSLSYTVKPEDVNGRLVVQQVARNSLGSDLDDTPTEVVAAVPPSATPVVYGTAQVGQELLGSEGFLSGTSPSVTGRQWLRCGADGGACEPIAGATGEQYVLTADDADKTLRFNVTVQGPQHVVQVASDPTAVVRPAPTPEQPTPPPPAPGGGQDESPPPSPPRPQAPRIIEPFPTVVIAGRVFPAGADVTTLLVRAPRGSLVRIRCRGRGCPVSRQRRVIRGDSLHLRRFETNLPAGTLLEIRVTMEGRIGKFTRLRIRGNRPPGRLDRCISPTGRAPVRCPAAVG